MPLWTIASAAGAFASPPPSRAARFEIIAPSVSTSLHYITEASSDFSIPQYIDINC